jgi:hypothetical protein
MRRAMAFRALSVGAIALFLIVANVAPIEASHSWGGYHWARTSNPFTVKLGDNLSSSWTAYLATASSDWTQSSVLDAPVAAGASKGNCRPTAGRVEVCDKNYGNNGWLGLAQIWITGGTHITQGVVKMNDTYFNTATYNNPNERQHVVCQEVGHTFGLDHQSEDGTSLNTCMDYFSNTGANAGSTLSTHPNKHDYDELAAIYAHFDSFTTVGAAAAAGPGASGANAAADGTPGGASPSRGSWYVEDHGGGRYLVTHVYWAEPGR